MGNKNEKGNKTPKQKRKGSFRVLTLGIQASGKSTFSKQMKILYGGGFSEDEVLDFRDILVKNAMIGMQELVNQAGNLELLPENKKRARFFKEVVPFDTEWTTSVGKKLKKLWQDPAIQQAWKNASGLQMTMMDYHMENLDRYSTEGFVPTNEDMLRARQRTTGFLPTSFMVENYSWTLIDVGGQKPERIKWDEIMGGELSAIIYFAALDEYNVVSTEEPSKTKMQIALQTFKEVVNMRETRECAMLLFLNKVDLFKKKLSTPTDFESFQQTFPDYEGGADVDKATEFIGARFTELIVKRPKDDLRLHVTCALDTDAMGTVFTAVRETIYLKRMAASGIKY